MLILNTCLFCCAWHRSVSWEWSPRVSPPWSSWSWWLEETWRVTSAPFDPRRYHQTWARIACVFRSFDMLLTWLATAKFQLLCIHAPYHNHCNYNYHDNQENFESLSGFMVEPWIAELLNKHHIPLIITSWKFIQAGDRFDEQYLLFTSFLSFFYQMSNYGAQFLRNLHEKPKLSRYETGRPAGSLCPPSVCSSSGPVCPSRPWRRCFRWLDRSQTAWPTSTPTSLSTETWQPGTAWWPRISLSK